MKKFFTWFSLAVLTVISIYVSYKLAIMTQAHPTYEGIANLIVNDTIKKTSALNPCSAIVFAFRGYDTLGESFVLFAAITGSAAILRKYKRR